jgi:hypothetical protein
MDDRGQVATTFGSLHVTCGGVIEGSLVLSLRARYVGSFMSSLSLSDPWRKRVLTEVLAGDHSP